MPQQAQWGVVEGKAPVFFLFYTHTDIQISRYPGIQRRGGAGGVESAYLLAKPADLGPSSGNKLHLHAHPEDLQATRKKAVIP